MKRRFIKILTILGVATPLGILCLYQTSLSYPYCLVMESQWAKARTQHELESRLFAFYRCFRIDPDMTVWKNDPPKEGQRILRYLIFGKERLDVVVADDGSLVAMFTAYE
jgi:hypothetical protein